MSETEKYVKCKNCHQEISESKIFLHEGFCLRNNKLCPECDKIFLIKEFEEHIKTHNANKEKIHPISEHRKNCHHHENKININNNKKEEKTNIKIDENLGLKQCIYCTNVFEDIQNHLKECEIKKMLEKENEKYYSDLEKRKKLDNDLAEKLAKEKIMDISKDEQLAKELQNNMKPLIDINKDEEMALNLQKQFQMENNNTSKDEEIARNLQEQLGNEYNIQQDEQYARMLQQQEDINNNYNNFPDNIGYH